MAYRSTGTLALVLAHVLAATSVAQGTDPRTPAGQLAACSGTTTWPAIGYLEFRASVQTPEGLRGPWTYRWDRANGYLRAIGPGGDGREIDVAIELASRSGGGFVEGKQLMGAQLADAVGLASRRFLEDVLWLTFPLEWGAGGATVAPLADIVGEDGVTRQAVSVVGTGGSWKVTLDPETGRVARTVLQTSDGTVTADWSEWRQTGGVFFAGRRDIAETGEAIVMEVVTAARTAPADAF